MGISHSSRYTSTSHPHIHRSSDCERTKKNYETTHNRGCSQNEQLKSAMTEGIFLPENSNIKDKDHFGVFRFRRSERSGFNTSNNPYVNEHGILNDYYLAMERRKKINGWFQCVWRYLSIVARAGVGCW